MGSVDTVRRTCDARIWPSWAPGWVHCGSGIMPDGRCIQYGHPDHAGRCIPGKCMFGHAHCEVADSPVRVGDTEMVPAIEEG
jgi:hypothetical protein